MHLHTNQCTAHAHRQRAPKPVAAMQCCNCSLPYTPPCFLQWSEMASLTSLSLSWNKLTGPLPASFSALSNLQALVLHFNRFTGAQGLRVLGMKCMEAAAGITSGSTDGRWPLLEAVIGHRYPGISLVLPQPTPAAGAPRTCARAGTLPPSWGALRKLWMLSPGGALHGTLPPECGNMTGLSELYLGLEVSNLTGTIPASWGGMTNLTKFWLYGLPRMTGCAPHAWKLRGVQVTAEKTGLDARVFCDAR